MDAEEILAFKDDCLNKLRLEELSNEYGEKFVEYIKTLLSEAGYVIDNINRHERFENKL